MLVDQACGGEGPHAVTTQVHRAEHAHPDGEVGGGGARHTAGTARVGIESETTSGASARAVSRSPYSILPEGDCRTWAAAASTVQV